MEAAGIKVEWNDKLGTPSSIRGPGLDQQAAWSRTGARMAAAATATTEQRAFAVLDNLASAYQMRDARSEFQAQRIESDTLGFQHVRLAQTYQGLRVFGGELLVHFDRSGRAYQVNGEYVADIQSGLNPAITAADAEQTAAADLASQGHPAGQLTSGPQLVIFAFGIGPQLAYELTLSYESPATGPAQWRYWIGAADGAVLLRYDDVKHGEAQITGNLLPGEGGQVVTVTGWYDDAGKYYLRNPSLLYTIINEGGTAGYPDNGTYAFRATNDWGNSDPVEVSAANNFAIVSRYFREVHGRNGWNNAGGDVDVHVHYGNQMANAYWRGGGRMDIGDGDGSKTASYAVLDVCGHELSHGVDESTANLTYSGESGALNESFSDIFGSSIESYGQADGRGLYPGKSPGTADWCQGEDYTLAWIASRDLRNPRHVTTLTGGQPSRYHGTFWYYGSDDNGGVHENSGVQNFVFYLLSEGGSGNNDGLAYSVTGIGVTNAEKVAYRALTVYCTSYTDYTAARSA